MLMKTKPAFLAKMQDGLASSRAAILWVIKGLLAAFTGLLTTSAVMVAFEFTAHKIRPVAGARYPSLSRACVAASRPFLLVGTDAPFISDPVRPAERHLWGFLLSVLSQILRR